MRGWFKLRARLAAQSQTAAPDVTSLLPGGSGHRDEREALVRDTLYHGPVLLASALVSRKNAHDLAHVDGAAAPDGHHYLA